MAGTNVSTDILNDNIGCIGRVLVISEYVNMLKLFTFAVSLVYLKWLDTLPLIYHTSS